MNRYCHGHHALPRLRQPSSAAAAGKVPSEIASIRLRAARLPTLGAVRVRKEEARQPAPLPAAASSVLPVPVAGFAASRRRRRPRRDYRFPPDSGARRRPSSTIITITTSWRTAVASAATAAPLCRPGTMRLTSSSSSCGPLCRPFRSRCASRKRLRSRCRRRRRPETTSTIIISRTSPSRRPHCRRLRRRSRCERRQSDSADWDRLLRRRLTN
jgi:hypothetical protein